MRSLDSITHLGFFLSAALSLLLPACGGNGSDGNDPRQNAVSAIRIGDVTIDEGSDGGVTPMDFVLVLDQPNTEDIQVDFATRNLNTEDTDLEHRTGTLVIPAGETRATITINVVADRGVEFDEDFVVEMSNPSSNATLADAEARGKIINDDLLDLFFDILSIKLLDDAVLGLAFDIEFEATFTIEWMELSDAYFHLDFYFEGDELHIPLFLGYREFSQLDLSINGTVYTAAGHLELPAFLPDFGPTGNLLGKLELRNLSGQPFPEFDTELNTTIDVDLIPKEAALIYVGDAIDFEGDSGSTTDLRFTARLTQALPVDIVIDYQTSDGMAVAPQDYQPASGSFTIPANQTRADFTVTVNGDDDVESLESIVVSLTRHDGGTAPANVPVLLMDRQAIGWIKNDDGGVINTLRVGNAELTEGDTGSQDMIFELTLDAPAAAPIEVSWTTIDNPATTHPALSGEDYTAVGGSLTIQTGESRATVAVPVHGDDTPEYNEQFLLLITRATTAGGLIDTREGVGAILSDDITRYAITVKPAQITEGDSGSQDLVFDVALDPPARTPVDFDYATEDDSGLGHPALSGEDYTAVSGSQTLQVGESRFTVAVPIRGDTTPEYDEQFRLSITSATTDAVATFSGSSGIGSILTDDPLADITIDDVALPEGSSGETTQFAFTVSLSSALEEDLMVDYFTEDVTASSGSDYTAANGSITIPAGDIGASIVIMVTGDDDPEVDELFRVVLNTSSASAVLVDASADGAILNDDGAGGWSGMETVYHSGKVGSSIQPQYPQLAFGPGGERQVLFKQRSAIWSTRSSAPGVWSPPVEIGPAESSSRPEPSLFIDDNGTGVALWNDPNVASAAYTPGAGWQVISLPQGVEASQQIRLAGDPLSGEAIAVWEEPWWASSDGINNVWSSRYVPGTGWQDMGLVERVDFTSTSPQLALPPSGEAIVVLSQQPVANGRLDIVAYHLVNDVWQGPTLLDGVDGRDAFAPRIDVNAAGDAAVVWQQVEPVPPPGFPQQSVYINRYDADGGGWLGAELVELDQDRDAKDPRVSIDAHGNVFVIWEQRSPVTNSHYDLMTNRYDAATGTWSGARLLEFLDTPFDDIYDQQIVADDEGNAIAVWSQSDGTVFNLRAARYSAADDGWGPAEPLEQIDDASPAGVHLIMDRASGDAMVVWFQSNNFSVDILANRYTAP